MEEDRITEDIRELEERLDRLRSTATQMQKLEGKIDQLVAHFGMAWKPCPEAETGKCHDGRDCYGDPCDVCHGAGVVLDQTPESYSKSFANQLAIHQMLRTLDALHGNAQDDAQDDDD